VKLGQPLVAIQGAAQRAFQSDGLVSRSKYRDELKTANLILGLVGPMYDKIEDAYEWNQFVADMTDYMSLRKCVLPKIRLDSRAMNRAAIGSYVFMSKRYQVTPFS